MGITGLQLVTRRIFHGLHIQSKQMVERFVVLGIGSTVIRPGRVEVCVYPSQEQVSQDHVDTKRRANQVQVILCVKYC